MEKVRDFMGTTLDSVIIEACLLQECFQVTAREPAKHTSVYIANMSPFDRLLSLGNWFRLYGTASTYPRHQAHRNVAYQRWEVLQTSSL